MIQVIPVSLDDQVFLRRGVVNVRHLGRCVTEAMNLCACWNLINTDFDRNDKKKLDHRVSPLLGATGKAKLARAESEYLSVQDLKVIHGQG
jgi:hypothetical protein